MALGGGMKDLEAASMGLILKGTGLQSSLSQVSFGFGPHSMAANGADNQPG